MSGHARRAANSTVRRSAAFWRGRGGAAIALLVLLTGLIAPVAVVSLNSWAAPNESVAPAAPAELFFENFENGVDGSVQKLEDYIGAMGARYTADPYWIDLAACNGFIMQYSAPASVPKGYCGDALGDWDKLRVKAYALGLLVNNPEKNRVIASNTSTTGGQPNQIQFTTKEQLALKAANRFVTFSVDAAASACEYVNPKLRFYLKTADGTEVPVSSEAINPCTDQRSQKVTVDSYDVIYGRFVADNSLLLTSDSLGIVMRNESGEAFGNDGAFDNIRVLDATPQLTQSFAAAKLRVGETTRLTLTVTNTNELTAKQGWGFTNELPKGLVVASTPGLTNGCAADVEASDGAIKVSNGTLAKGETSCTISVDVTSKTPAPAEPSPKTYQNCATNFTDVLGMNLPACASLEFFTEPSLEIKYSSNWSTDVLPGAEVEYTVTATNTGDQNYTIANPALLIADLSEVLDDANFILTSPKADQLTQPIFTGSKLTWAGPLEAGASLNLTYRVRLKATGDGTVRSVVWQPKNLANPVAPSCESLAKGVDSTSGEPCAATAFELPRLSITQAADVDELAGDGEVATFTTRVTNEGPGSFTQQAPASVEIDLADVLDDAELVAGSLTPTAGAKQVADKLTWSGALAAGESVEVSYQVKYDATRVGVNKLVRSVACLPEVLAAKPDNACQSVGIPAAAALVEGLSVDLAGGNSVKVGQEISFTLQLQNPGGIAVLVASGNDLSGILDDALFVADSIQASAGLSVTLKGDLLVISGELPAHSSATVSYRVKIKPTAERGDSSLVNKFAGCTSATAGCSLNLTVEADELPITGSPSPDPVVPPVQTPEPTPVVSPVQTPEATPVVPPVQRPEATPVIPPVQSPEATPVPSDPPTALTNPNQPNPNQPSVACPIGSQDPACGRQPVQRSDSAVDPVVPAVTPLPAVVTPAEVPPPAVPPAAVLPPVAVPPAVVPSAEVKPPAVPVLETTNPPASPILVWPWFMGAGVAAVTLGVLGAVAWHSYAKSK